MDGQIDGQMDRQTDRQGQILMPPDYRHRGIKISDVQSSAKNVSGYGSFSLHIV